MAILIYASTHESVIIRLSNTGVQLSLNEMKTNVHKKEAVFVAIQYFCTEAYACVEFCTVIRPQQKGKVN